MSDVEGMLFPRRITLGFIAALLATVFLSAVASAEPFRFNNLAERDSPSKQDTAPFISADMSSDDKNAVLVRVHEQIIATPEGKDQVLRFIVDLVEGLRGIGEDIEGIVLIEGRTGDNPFLFFPYHDGYIHPHVREGIVFINNDTMANARMISQGLELSRIAQRGQ